MPLTWRRARPVPLDLNGPIDRAYPALPDDFAERPIYRLLADATARDPAATAVVDGRETLSYGALLRCVRRAACNLAAAGSGPIAVLMRNTPSGVAALLGCLVARRIVLLLDGQQPAARNAAILRDCGATALLCAADAANVPASDLPRIDIERLFDGADHPDWTPPAPFAPDAPAMVFFTSGSTGRPKGIVVSLWALLHRGRLMADALHIGPDDRLLNCSQASANSSFARYLAVLGIGARLVLYQPAEDGITALGERLRENAVTILVANPALLRTLLSLPALHGSFATVRALRSAGAALLQADIDAARAMLPGNCSIDTTYASTEAGIVAAWLLPADYSAHGPRLPSGYLVDGLELALLDAIDGTGELLVRGRGVALGEWRNGRCVPGHLPADPDRPGWRVFRTGDLVRLGADDLLYFVSRADQQIKINGVRIEPAEIEAVLRRVPGVSDAVIVAHTEGVAVKLTAYVAADGDAETLRACLRERLRADLPAAMRPARLEVLERLPRLAGGKLDLLALADLAARTAS